MLSVSFFAWKKNTKPTTKPSPRKTPHQSLGFCLVRKVFCCRWLWGNVPAASVRSPLSTCPDGQSEGKRICARVPQATTDPHSPKVPFFPLQWEVSCFILCCRYLFCQSRTLCLAVQGLEGPQCAMSLSLNVSASCWWNHSLAGAEQPVSLAGHWWPGLCCCSQFWEHTVVIQSSKWLRPLLTVCNTARGWGRDLNPKEIASVYMNWEGVWNAKVSSCSGFFVGSPSSFLFISYDRMKFIETFHFPDSCPRSRNSGWGRIYASLSFFSLLQQLSCDY